MRLRLSENGVLDRHTQRYLMYVLAAACCVYLAAHFSGFINPYLINDDVRQQIYWMQRWIDPELFQDDWLTWYAIGYVPWGVKAIYWAASSFMNPVQFSKVLAPILYVITAGFLFGLGARLSDELTAILVVCVFFLSSSFMDRIAGGLSRGFAFPLLAAHLFFLAGNNLGRAAWVVLLEALVNPYLFLVCFVTQAVCLAHCLTPLVLKWPARSLPRSSSAQQPTVGGADTGAGVSLPSQTEPRPLPFRIPLMSFSSIMMCSLPLVAGLVVMGLQYVILRQPELGELVSRAEMVGNIEYTALGRYPILPAPSIFYELIRPWFVGLRLPDHSPISLVVGGASLAAWTVAAAAFRRELAALSGMRVFVYLFIASAILYVAAQFFLLKLFWPRRYVEYSLTVFYCVTTAVFIRCIIDRFKLISRVFPHTLIAAAGLGAILSHNRGLQDYSQHADLYKFLETTPKTSLVAGHPQLMDNVPTFARRKVFVNTELSHAWVQPYWGLVKARTFDFFRAYYARDPQDIREFCRKYGIQYIAVRDSDFSPTLLREGRVYFEPFGEFVKKLVSDRSSFAVLDTVRFPPVYYSKGIRVIRVEDPSRKIPHELD